MGWRRLQFRGRTGWLDENSLELVCGDERPAKGAAPEHQHRQPAAPARPHMLVFNLTHRCNLACDYCFVQNYYPQAVDSRPKTEGNNSPSPQPSPNGRGNKGDGLQPTAYSLKPMTMPPAVALRALSLFAPRRDMQISFFGGEPLLAWETLVLTAEAAKALAAHSGLKARFHVTTNGTLLDEQKARWLAGNGFSMIVSLDGPPEIHDAYRRFAHDAAGSFDATMRGLEAVRRFPRLAMRTTLRGTFTADCVDLLKRVAFLNDLCDCGFAGNVSVEPASLVTEGCAALPQGHPQALRPCDMRRLRGEYDALADWWLERWRAGRKARFFHFAKMLERLEKRRPACSDCGAGWGYMCVNPAGELHACHREGNPIGDAWKGISEAARAEWLDNRYYARQKCPTCWARNICGGGCRKDSWDKSGDIRQPDALACAIRIIWLLEATYLHVCTGQGHNLMRSNDSHGSGR